jgi:hypothetical protein
MGHQLVHGFSTSRNVSDQLFSITNCKASLITAALALIVSSAATAEVCQFPALHNQRQDVATIETLELEWSRAYLRGDTAFEACLLTADFTEIMRNGEVKHLADELALAARNTAKPLPMREIPKGIVLLHGNVAVAYGRSQNAVGTTAMRYADYYVWEDGQWHAYFAQQTEIAQH